MSGVYIPNWKKPENCDVCWAEYAYDICNSHSDSCPLIEVPPHGRLIDADELLKPVGSYEPIHYSYVDGYVVPLRDISNAPTIIPAEEGE